MNFHNVRLDAIIKIGYSLLMGFVQGLIAKLVELLQDTIYNVPTACILTKILVFLGQRLHEAVVKGVQLDASVHT